MSVRERRSVLFRTRVFLKWCAIALLTGLAGGLVGTLFHKSVETAGLLRTGHPWLLFCLPAAGLLIVFTYKVTKMDPTPGTNLILRSVRSEEKIPLVLLPLIFLGTVLTHLTGGSAGREGAALQLGGGIGAYLGRAFRLDEKDLHLATLCGMSALFSALFGTPVTAVFFVLEVVSVGIIHYSGIVPCMVSSITAFSLSRLFGVSPTRFSLTEIPSFGLMNFLRVLLLAILCAVVSVFFCQMMHGVHHLFQHFFPNKYLRVLVGSAILIGLTLLCRTTDYNGAGMEVILRATEGSARWEAFLLKIVFTAVTLGCGFKGGEIVPTFFVGATFGCAAGALLGLPASFGAAVGLIALFCGAVNCPVASLMLSVELFGAEGIIYFTAAVAVTYMLSGYHSLYSSQKIIYSKFRPEFIDRMAKDPNRDLR